MQDIDAFISSIAAAAPLPAGGSAAALAGALAAALGEMMAGLTEGRETFASVQSQVHLIHAKLTSLRGMFRTLVLEDAAAYQSLLDAKRLPRETEVQKAARSDAIEQCTRGATETPLRMARIALEVLEYLKILFEIGNPHVKYDIATGVQLACAVLKSGQYNILANIRGMRDASFANSCGNEISDLVLRGSEILQQIERQVMAH
jgi:formiminotetrahydrofolate cyclodeaminase